MPEVDWQRINGEVSRSCQRTIRLLLKQQEDLHGQETDIHHPDLAQLVREKPDLAKWCVNRNGSIAFSPPLFYKDLAHECWSVFWLVLAEASEEVIRATGYHPNEPPNVNSAVSALNSIKTLMEYVGTKAAAATSKPSDPPEQKPRPEGQDAIQWSTAYTVAELAKLFRVSRKAMGSMLKNQRVPNRKINRQSYQIPTKDVPRRV
jgi:hypothetical protein